MGLDDIKLSPFLVKELYSNSMIDNANNTKALGDLKKAKDVDLVENIEKKPSNKIIEGTIKFLGKNAKNILLVIAEKDHAFLGDDELSFLMNILNACGISMQDVALVNAQDNDAVVYENLNDQFAPEKIIFLGTEPHLLDFPVQIPTYKIQSYNKQQYLSAPSLQILSSDTAEKKKLWMVLKELFGI
jgi:Fe-S cluster assembly scaffold protein SufB